MHCVFLWRVKKEVNMVEVKDDNWFLEGLAKGDEKTYEAFFLKFYTPLVVFARKVIVDDDLARELVQDVFVHFYEKRQDIQIHTSLKAHLYQSVKNKCLNQIKREQIRRDHHANIFIDKKNEESVFDDCIEETELEEKIFSIIQSLPDQCRKIFEKSRFDGQSNQEIADELNLSKRTVETQISKALKVLRLKLSDYVMLLCLLLFVK